ncbi:hypothetical protein ACH5RR_040572 [Cinchona calisaya]|uniref:Uncharacterized protein n=1 Tax=Cinchona calisaya TaxID=153742 RepID=A0ABD2XUQ4_9GENT
MRVLCLQKLRRVQGSKLEVFEDGQDAEMGRDVTTDAGGRQEANKGHKERKRKDYIEGGSLGFYPNGTTIGNHSATASTNSGHLAEGVDEV